MATVAIVTPVYATYQNRRIDLLYQTIRSVIDQQCYARTVHIIVDDSSTVDIQSLLKQFKQPQIRYVRREVLPTDFRTASNPLNYGIDLCKTGEDGLLTKEEAESLQGITYIHSDDILTPDSVEIRFRHLGNGFVHTRMAFFTNDRAIRYIRNGKDAKNPDNINWAAGYNFIFNAHTIMWRPQFLQYLKVFVKRKFNQDGIFDPFIADGEDLDMFLSSARAAIEGEFDVRYINEVTVWYRNHQQSMLVLIFIYLSKREYQISTCLLEGIHQEIQMVLPLV